MLGVCDEMRLHHWLSSLQAGSQQRQGLHVAARAQREERDSWGLGHACAGGFAAVDSLCQLPGGGVLQNRSDHAVADSVIGISGH